MKSDSRLTNNKRFFTIFEKLIEIYSWIVYENHFQWAEYLAGW